MYKYFVELADTPSLYLLLRERYTNSFVMAYVTLLVSLPKQFLSWPKQFLSMSKQFFSLPKQLNYTINFN